MVRRESFTFVDIDPDTASRKAYCQRCEDFTGKLQKLVPRYNNGVLDDKFKQCSYCGELYPIYDVKYYAEYEPKGVPITNPFDTATKVVAIKQKRTKKADKHLRAVDNDQDIPDFAGKPDQELINMQNEGAIINSISDSNDENE